jgi:hypothetical protein
MKNRKDGNQKPLPFDDPPACPPPAVEPATPPTLHTSNFQPSREALATLERLEEWLADPRTGKPITEMARETLDVLNKALRQGRRPWWHCAEDMLAALALRNGRTAGEDIPSGKHLGEGLDFRGTIEELMDRLDERFTARGR